MIAPSLTNFTQAINLKPNDPKYAAAHYNRGMAYRSKFNKTQEAMADLDEALRLAPNAPWSAKAKAAKTAIIATLPCIGGGCPPRAHLGFAQSSSSDDDSGPPRSSPFASPESAPNTQFVPVFLGREGSAL
jgi:tetratricopeptide (TPR) repeat protein